MKAFQLTLKNEKKKQFLRIAFLLAFINLFIFFYISFTTGNKFLYFILAGVIMICLAFLFSISQREFTVKINQQSIRYPSFPARHFRWTDLNNVVLKDGILTIDFKNNKLIQQHIDANKPSPDEKDFNEFCMEQLRTAKPI